jgi:hypothetical protein
MSLTVVLGRSRAVVLVRKPLEVNRRARLTVKFPARREYSFYSFESLLTSVEQKWYKYPFRIESSKEGECPPLPPWPRLSGC